jgi:SAM-dependent methyltransferase
MFFADPSAAFANLARALRPGGRLVMMVWQAGEDNEWDVAIRRSLQDVSGPMGDRSGAFSLADPVATAEVLRAAGFVDIDIAAVDEPVFYGPDVETALAWVRGFTCTRDVMERLDPTGSARALGRLRAMLSAHRRDDGVWLGSRSWIVSARRR